MRARTARSVCDHWPRGVGQAVGVAPDDLPLAISPEPGVGDDKTHRDEAVAIASIDGP